MATDETRGRPVRVTTQRMAYGPHAVGRLDGKVLFVRGAAPDEEVDAVIREDRKSYAYADTVAVVRASIERRTPPCPYLPRCGGCPWQHLTYQSQLTAKREIVREQLRRVAGLDLPVEPVLPSARELGYRRRIKLRVDGGAVGYYAAATHELVPIEHCLLAEPHVDAAIGAVGELAHRLRAPLRRIELLGRDASATAVVASGEVEGGWESGDEVVCIEWIAEHPQIAGLVLSGRGWRRSWGEVWIDIDAEPDLSLRVHAPAFTQVNPRANLALVETVVGLAAPAAGMRVLDLFAGAGNFSLPLHRRGAEIVAVEQDRQAAADAVANAAGQSGAGFRVIRARAERAVADLARTAARFDLALLDPPRSGAAACLTPLMELAPARIIYVSCDPATLARDLRGLGDRYRVDVVQPIDMFPHTYHVETVVHATLSCESRTPGVSSARRHGSAEPRRRRRTRGRRS